MANEIGVSLKLDGMRQVVEALGKKSKTTVAKAIRKGIRNGAKVVAQAAKQLVPFDTGTLKKSIKVRSTLKRKKDLIQMVVITGNKDSLFQGKQFYAGFQEWGTKKHPAHPFLRPAFDATTAQAEAAIVQTIKDELQL